MTAETAPKPVMAEQISHNVVDNTESTSASPPVDAAANQTTPASAEHGTLDQPLVQTKTDQLQTSQDSDVPATEADASISSLAAVVEAGEGVVNPSAGDTATLPGEASTASPALATSDDLPGDNELLVSGVGGTEYVAVDDGNVPEGSIDVSTSSDAEGSRGDGGKADDEIHHARTNSVKKPTTFSKVSVTKNFLAKSATTAQPTLKAGDKPSPAGTPPAASMVARPRLIAKTGASIQQKTRLGSESTSGPDASKVWNKNRPIAPPPPKSFTDEELKQQYGIHLATRLQTDENGKDKAWADIEDDEDDWAPESVVWMDGTKSTLTASETAAPLEEEKPATPPPQKLASGVRPTLAVKRTTEMGPMKTILKAGASTAAAQAKQNGDSSASAGDKASGQGMGAPAKSPWAALPPVERISPVNPPVQQQQTHQLRFATQDARAYEQAPPTEPPREIATDTFRREGRDGGPKELFNSANGLYEPVTDGRRGSIKVDSGTRKTALLQRSSQSSASPAEPSAAFQTRTASQGEASMARRRNSSISQGSLPRRMSTSKGSDLSPAPERRTSTAVSHDSHASPQMARAEPVQPAFAQQSAWQQQMPQRPEAGNEEEDPVKKQDRVMREKRESAKKRRQEEEEQQEASKQERLKARLAALEGAGKSRKEREAEAAATSAAASATPAGEAASEVTSSTPSAEEPRTQPSQLGEIATPAPPTATTQPLATSVQESQPRPASEETLPSPLPSKAHFTGGPDRPTSSTDQSNPRQQQRPHLSPRAGPRAPFQGPPSGYGQATSSYSSPGDRKLEPFGRSPISNSNAFSSPWPTAGAGGNMWSTSGIGNGVFDSSSAFSPMQQGSTLPPPPGMNRPSASSRISPQAMAQDTRSPNLQHSAMAESHRGFAPPGFESRPDPFANQNRTNGSSPAPGLARPPHAPGPIAPPSRAHQQAGQRDERLKAWNSAAETLPERYRSDADAAAQRAKIPSGPSAPRDDTIKETFRKTIPQATLGGPRKYATTEYTVHDAQGSRSVESHSPVPPHAQTQANGPFVTKSPLQTGPWSQAGENTVRIPDGSLHASHGAMPAHQPPIAPPSATQQQRAVSTPLFEMEMFKDQSPPPPETSSHPVNMGDIEHPLVRLPPGKPVVKLPPAPAQMQPPVLPPQNAMMPQRPISNWGAPGSSKPIVMQQAWQERFNGLFNRTPIHTEVPPSPPGTPPKEQSPALAVAASTRTAMDELSALNVATVSLPQSKRTISAEGFTIDDSEASTSKAAFEETFMEELNFGFKPTIAMPRTTVYQNKDYLLRPLPKPPGSMWRTVVAAQSYTPLKMLDILPKHRDGIFVNLPGSRIRNRLVRAHAEPRRPGQHNDERQPSGRFNKGKGKEIASNAPPPTGPSSNSGSKSESASGQASPAVASSPGVENKPSGYPKPRRGGGGRRAHTQPPAQSVKGTQ